MRNNPVINLSAYHRSILLILTLPILAAANLVAGSSLVKDSNTNLAESLDQTMVRYSGADARVELQLSWEAEITGTAPDARQFSPLEYIPGVSSVLMFGGYNSNNSPRDSNDTWLLSAVNNTWNPVSPITSPPQARHGHSIAWLSGSKALLFGGYNDDVNQYKSDTWIYDASLYRWDEVICSTYPPARAFSSMCRTANSIVLFGGQDSSGRYSDTWSFDVAAQTWSYLATAVQPSARYGSGAAYNSANSRMYLFGGFDTALKQDLWSYYPATNTWVNLGTGGPTARKDAGLIYDKRNNCLMVFGGYDGNARNDLYFYKNSWNPGNPDSVVSTPSARSGQGMVYVSTYGALIFGGVDNVNTYLQDSRYLVFRSTGVFTSYTIEIPFSTSLEWKSIGFDPSSQPAGTVTRLQLATSQDGFTWDSFRGSSTGDPDLFYEFGVGNSTATPLWPGHTNRRYLKYRYFLNSNTFPDSPRIDTVIISYNQAPAAPVLLNPLDQGSTNSVNPLFTWTNSSDPDGDPLTYEFQLDDDPGFNPPLISTTGIPSGGGVTTSTSPAFNLATKTYYWRARANDGLTALSWSNSYTLFVDTIAPGMVTDLVALTGLGTGEIQLSWTSPGNNDYSGSITNGFYQVRFATYGPINEAIYSSIPANQRMTQFSFTKGLRYNASITGLANDTTYYFAMKIGDSAGNFSLISSSSPFEYTNAAPTVALSTPVGGEYWTATRDIVWTSYDPNWYETRSFSIYASSDSGVNYTINVTTYALTNGTTFYRWDTRLAPNSASFRIKVVATDLRGLTGSATSTANLEIFNPNDPPTVTVGYPNGVEVLFGTVNLTWSIADYNGSDSHTSEVYISGDSGNTYPWHYNASGTSYSLNTRLLPNGAKYRVKVVATDSGSPPAQGTDVSDADCSIDNQNVMPNAFSLTYPPDNASRSILDINFQWENTGDPNPEDTLSYDLYYGTAADLGGAAHVAGITSNSYKANPLNIVSDRQYYWRVVALDPLGLQKQCSKDFAVYALSRFKTESADNKIKAEILEGLPDNGFLNITTIDASLSQAISAANRDTIIDRNIMRISDNAYRIAVYDINGNEIQVDNPKLYIIAFYDDADNNGYCDGTLLKSEQLQCAILNETKNRWELADSKPVLDKSAKSISFNLSRFGSMAFLGALTPQTKISGVVNYPNPFPAGKSPTRIRYVLTESADVTLRIYTLAGDLVWDKTITAGTEGAKGSVNGYSNEVEWDGNNGSGIIVANGMYILEIKQSGERQIRKIGVVK